MRTLTTIGIGPLLILAACWGGATASAEPDAGDATGESGRVSVGGPADPGYTDSGSASADSDSPSPDAPVSRLGSSSGSAQDEPQDDLSASSLLEDVTMQRTLGLEGAVTDKTSEITALSNQLRATDDPDEVDRLRLELSLEMLELQSLTNKLSQAESDLSDALTALGESKSAIVGNIR